MTDKEKLEKLLTEFGIAHSVCMAWNDNHLITISTKPPEILVHMDFEFNSEGKFISMGAWE